MAVAMFAAAPSRAQSEEQPNGLTAPVAAGALLGTAIGGAWVLRNRAANAPAGRWGDGTVAALMAVGTGAGATIGLVSGVWRRPTPGRAFLTPTLAVISAAGVGLLAASTSSIEGRRDDRGFLAAALTAEFAAIGATWVGRRIEPSLATSAWLIAGAAGGAASFGGAAYAFSRRPSRGVLLASGTGLLVGAALAYAFGPEF